MRKQAPTVTNRCKSLVFCGAKVHIKFYNSKFLAVFLLKSSTMMPKFLHWRACEYASSEPLGTWRVMAPTEYYDLQGVRVKEPASGQIVITKKGGKVTKMIF